MPISPRLLIILFVCLLSACSTQQRLHSADPAQANEVLFSAMNQVGKPYRYGGSSPQTGFDCSGLVDYVYRSSTGLKLPRTTAEMSHLPGPDVPEDSLESGDLLIFATGFTRRADHAGIYVGKGRFVHAPSKGGKVRLDRLSDTYWQKHFLTAKRPLLQVR